MAKFLTKLLVVLHIMLVCHSRLDFMEHLKVTSLINIRLQCNE